MKERIYEMLREIPKGKVMTYGQIAEALGDKHLARYVGNMLHDNPDGEKNPCYKVVRHDGSLSEQYAFGGAEEQARKLMEDGIRVENGKVNLKIYGYRHTLRVALLQIAPTGSLEGNLQKGFAYCRMAKEQGADVALFPEMFSCGYDIYERPPEVWKRDGISSDHPFVEQFGELAAELSMAIGVTFLEKTSRGVRNSMVLFDRKGRRVLSYAKVHTCDFSVEKDLEPGNAFCVADLDTAQGIVKVGSMICYDREFPESARILMLKGAEIVLVPNACPMEINRLSQLRARAYENMFGIATCNYPDSVPDCNGHSSAFDGVAYLPHLSGSRDTCILEADGREDVFLADFDLDMIRTYRAKEVHGNCYRRPEQYGILTEQRIEAPFIRSDRRKQE